MSVTPTIGNLKKLQDYLNSLPKNQPVIGFFANYVYHNQHKWLDAIAAKCRERGFITIGLLTGNSIEVSEFTSVDFTAVVTPFDIESLKRINVFVISDVDGFVRYPAESKVLGCQHALYCNQNNLTLASYSRWMHFLDGFIIPMQLNEAQRRNIPLLWNNFLAKDQGMRKRENFYLIPAPYPRLAMLEQELSKCRNHPDSIVYAPVWAAYSQHMGGMRIRDYGAPMIGRLLDEFPGKNVIFRPSYQDFLLPEVLKIIDTYSQNDRFLMDYNVEQADTFSRGAALITDISFVGKSFSFGTLRPAIEYRPWTQGEPGLDKDAGCYREFNLDGLIALVRNILADPDKYTRELKSVRDRLAVSPENGLDRLADMIGNFLADQPENSWITIPRFSDQTPEDVEIILKLEKYAEGREDFPAALAAVDALPESPLLTAYAIHMSKLRNPSFPRFLNVGDPWSSILGKGVKLPYKYEKVPPDMVVKLYMLALKEKQRKKDERGIALVLKLMKAFRKFANSGFAPEPGQL